jgi:hypothetical protein
MASVQNRGAGRGRGNNSLGGLKPPRNGHYNDRLRPLMYIPKELSKVLKHRGVGDRYHLCLTRHNVQSAGHRAHWMNCGDCVEHGKAIKGVFAPCSAR